jgi:hypothetical protein
MPMQETLVVDLLYGLERTVYRRREVQKISRHLVI